jgi:hypothetical protein
MRIGKKVIEENKIPLSAFEEIFKDTNKAVYLFSLLKLNEKEKQQSEELDQIQKRKFRL